MPSIKEIKKALKTMDNDQLENFYINKIMPFDKRSMNEIIEENLRLKEEIKKMTWKVLFQTQIDKKRGLK
mgnify:CR=1 FL=1|tara:strand:- start:146 stop:355 length:210 start_codon:yes stop_codon:yes gene_type:complete